MKKAMKRMLIILAAVVMAIGMVGGTLFSILSNSSQKSEKTTEKDQKEYLSYDNDDFDIQYFYTYLVKEGLPVQNMIKASDTSSQENVILSVHWEDTNHIVDSSTMLNPGGYLEQYDDAESATNRLNELKEAGFNHVYKKKCIVIALDNELTDEEASSYDKAFRRYTKTTYDEITS